MRSSRASNRAAAILALAAAIAVDGGVSAHRRDEVLQAARVAIDPGMVRLEIDLTPGIALAGEVIGEIDRDNDGALSADEQRAYANIILDALTVDADANRLHIRLTSLTFPETEAMLRGEGTIRLESIALLPRQAAGPHRLTFRNRHDPSRSVYLANALVPATAAVAINGQRRPGDQSELTIDYTLRAEGSTRAAWILGSSAIATLLLALLLLPLRARTS